MDEDLENQLKQEYPEIYSEDFTFECLDGWYPLIDATSHILATHRETREDLQIRQIKEKYGELRIHPNLSYGERSHVVTGAIELAKFMSVNYPYLTSLTLREEGACQ